MVKKSKFIETMNKPGKELFNDGLNKIFGGNAPVPVEADPNLLPTPKAPVTPPLAVPKYTFRKDGSVLEQLPIGDKIQSAVYTAQQWQQKIASEGGPGGGGFKPTQEQGATTAIANEVSKRVQEAVRAGQTPNYTKIFQDMAADVQLQESLTALPGQITDLNAQPIEPFQPMQQPEGQAGAFGATAAGGGIAAGALGSIVGGSASINPLTIIPTLTAFVGGVIAQKFFERGQNITKAGTSVQRSLLNQNKLLSIAESGQYPDRFELYKAYKKQIDDVLAAESYLKELQSTGKFVRTDVAKQLQIIEDWKELEKIRGPIFLQSIQSVGPNQNLSSFMNSEEVATQ